MLHSYFTMLCWSLLLSNMNQAHTQTPSLLGSPLRPPQCGKQNSVPHTAVSHQLSILYILSVVYIYTCVCVYSHMCQPNSSPASWYPHICSLCLCLYYWFANKIIYGIYLHSTYMGNTQCCFSLSDLLHSV